jgi:hypothetical protein
MQDRRELLYQSVFGALSLCIPGVVSASPHLSASRAGAIVGNNPSMLTQFARWLGRKPEFALLAFDQRGPIEFVNSISFIVAQGRAMGVPIIWSVPFPGPGQLEAVSAGFHDESYQRCASEILRHSPDADTIRVRLPWEFNLASNLANAAKSISGSWSGSIFISAWTHLSDIFRAASNRFQIIWCPNVGVCDFDPIHCLPPYKYYDIISHDIYLQKPYDHEGIFSWYRDEDRGLNWGVSLANEKGKLYGISEWGMNSDSFSVDLRSMVAWLNGLGSLLDHHCWWDRSDGINCCISAGSLSGLSAIYRAAFQTE